MSSTMHLRPLTRYIPLVTLLIALGGTPAAACSGAATDEAFGLLLAMPGAQPAEDG